MNKIIILIYTIILLSGCSSLQYYAEFASGQLDMISKERPINDVIRDDKTPDKIRQKLELIKKIKRFAIDELQLPDNGSYEGYVDLGREYVLWSVTATPELSMKPYQSCFLLVGCMNYRSYFEKEQAENFAAGLQKKGYETYIGGVAAFSTTGWLEDPVVSSMLSWSDTHLAGLVFHELTHQKYYVKGDTTFNESLAVFYQYYGIDRWLQKNGTEKSINGYKHYLTRKGDFKALVISHRSWLQMVYKSALTPDNKRLMKGSVYKHLQESYKRLKAEKWQGYRGYDLWFSKGLNNAKLALFSTYNLYVDSFNKIMEKQCNHSVSCFFSKVEQIGSMSKNERTSLMQSLLKE